MEKEKALREYLDNVIKANQHEFDFFSSIGLTGQMEYYSGKLFAYRMVQDILDEGKN